MGRSEVEMRGNGQGRGGRVGRLACMLQNRGACVLANQKHQQPCSLILTCGQGCWAVSAGRWVGRAIVPLSPYPIWVLACPTSPAFQPALHKCAKYALAGRKAMPAKAGELAFHMSRLPRSGLQAAASGRRHRQSGRSRAGPCTQVRPHPPARVRNGSYEEAKRRTPSTYTSKK